MQPGRHRSQARAPVRGSRAEGTAIRILHLVLSLVLGCAASAAEPGTDPEARVGRPLGRSTHVRSGHFTYRLGDVERSEDRIRVGLRLSNGTHRSYGRVMLRVVLFGEGGQIRAVELPVGEIRAEQTKSLVARFDDVTFQIEDVTLELIYALP